MSSPRVVAIDGDRSCTQRVREIAETLEAPFQQFTTAEELIEADDLKGIGVIVAEFRLMGINGIDMQQRLLLKNYDVQLVFHTSFAETWLTVSAMKNGAFTVLDKPARDHELWDNIRLAMERHSRLRAQNEVSDRLLESINALTVGQHKVLEAMIEGKPNKVVARQMDLSVRTVESYRHTIFEKTNTRSIAELVRLITIARMDRPQTL